MKKNLVILDPNNTKWAKLKKYDIYGKSSRVQLTFIFNHKYIHNVIFKHLSILRKYIFEEKKIETLMLNQRPSLHLWSE